MVQEQARLLWQALRSWFETDDGSLPDILVEGLASQQVGQIYGWLRQQSTLPSDARTWDNCKHCDVSLHDLPDPVGELQAGRIEPFRHTLPGLKMDGVELPLLSVFVEPQGLWFDYRKGAGWNEATVFALWRLLQQIQQFAPGARLAWRHSVQIAEMFLLSEFRL